MLLCLLCEQRTAYEMRMSDWSSDVCSSDLARRRASGGALCRREPQLCVDRNRGDARAGAGGRALCLHAHPSRFPRAEPRREDRDDAVAARVARRDPDDLRHRAVRSEVHTSELQSLMRISYAVFCLKKKKHEYDTKTQDT